MKNLTLNIAVALLSAGSMYAQLSIPEIQFTSTPNFLKMPERTYMGEAVGVATDSKGNVYVYTRTGQSYITMGTSRAFAGGGARLFEFDKTGKFVREIGAGLYGFVFAHTVRVDPQDNIWAVDEGSNMVIKFNPEGRVLMTMGRPPEAVEALLETPPNNNVPPAEPYLFNRPTDVAWDA